MLWFVDFNRIGRSSKKIRINEVLRTVVNILVCFNLPINVPGIKTAKVYQKYQTAITKFYSTRFRPNNKLMLIPTLSGCGIIENKKYDVEGTRDFKPSDIVAE
jgi:Cdc6-like AAA superfamily ATPase